jgi:gamma-glutamyltranspeptidase
MAISTDVTTTLLSLLIDGISPEDAVEQPRFTVPSMRSGLVLETRFPSEVVMRLREHGEKAYYGGQAHSAVQVVGFGTKGWQAAADPRKHGYALVE